MKIADYISKSIQESPSLYKDRTYELSKLKVLNHMFFTIGNGLEMADVEDPKEGGYVVDPSFKKSRKTDEWVRIKDKPYGKEKYKPIPKDYFDTICYYVYAGKHPVEVSCIKEEFGENNVIFRYKKEDDDEFNKPKLYKAENLHEFSPYPFSKNYSIACNVFYDKIFLQDDWMRELVILCRRTLEYFDDENQYKNNSYFPTEKAIQQDLNYFQETFKKSGTKGLNGLQKTWGYEVKETLPDYTEIENRKNDSWKEFHKRQLKFLTGFLKKYDILPVLQHSSK